MSPVIPCKPWVPVIPWVPWAPLSPASPVTWKETIMSSPLANGLDVEDASEDIVKIYQAFVSCPATVVIWYNIKSSVLPFSDILTCPFIVDEALSIVVINWTMLFPLSSVASKYKLVAAFWVELFNWTIPVPGSVGGEGTVVLNV